MADIFDKISGGLNKGVAVVGANSKAVVEKARVKTAIKNLEDEKKQLAELLGMKVYDIYKSGREIANEDIENFIEEITNRVQHITEQQEQLKKIEAEVRMVAGSNNILSKSCKCGYINSEMAKFCAKCGSAL